MIIVHESFSIGGRVFACVVALEPVHRIWDGFATWQVHARASQQTETNGEWIEVIQVGPGPTRDMVTLGVAEER